MQIGHSSELMTNQKHAVAMAPQAGFRLAQTRQAHGLIFSIGTDAIFYRTLEQPRSRAGWALRDESSALATRFGSSVAAKLFDLSQNLADARLNLALAVTVAGADRLVLALDHTNGDEDWDLPLEWEEVPFDAPDGPSRLVITGIYLAQHGRENATVVDILKDPDDPLRRIERFVIAPPGSTPRWQRHELAITLSADAISSVLGRKGGQLVDGIYTLGRLAETRELTYAQLKHPYGGNPMVSRFPLPPGSDAAEAAFALGANADGTTDLYLAAAGGLYYLAAGEQRDLAEPRRIAQHALLQDVTDLAADVQGRKIVVWGLNRQGQVFCLRGTVGQQGLEGAWSVPLPVLQGTLGVATLINRGEGGSVILAHGDDDRLIQLTEDPDTTLWSQRDIVLPPTAVSDVLSVTTYTTHVQVSDSNLPVADQEVAVWASGPCLVYINSLYHRLSPDTPTLVRSDANGTLTIVQQVDDIGVATYTLEAGGESVVADPMQRAHEKLSKVREGADLDVTLHDSQGRPRPLVGPGISGGQKDDTARGIAEFIKVGQTLPADGSPRGAVQARRPPGGGAGPAALRIFGARFTPEGGSFFEGWEAAARTGLRLEGGALLLSRPDGTLEDAGDAIAVAAGDLFRWIRHAAHEVEEFFVAYEQDVAHFFVRLAGKLYRMLITCLRDIANGVNFLLQKIEVALHDLVAWLGYLFQWPDIVRTHRVLKTLMHCFVRHSIDQLPVLRDDVEKAFRQIEREIESWAHLTPIPSSANGVAGSSAPMPGQHDPQSNWGAYHLKDNATSSETGWRQSMPESSPLTQLLEELKAMLEREETVFRDALEQLQTDVFDQLRTLPVTDILQRVVGIVLEAVLGTVENVLVTAIDIYTILAEGVLAMLETPIDIPVISQIYREATGDALTVLDAACLVAAIPVTLLYKLTDSQHETPFPDDDFTRALIAARDMQELRAVLQGGEGARALRQSAEYRKLEKVCALCAIPAAAVLCFVTPFRDAFSDNWALAVIGTITYVVYCAPNLPAIVEDSRSKWYNWLDFGITCFSIAKACGDVSLCAYSEKGPNPWLLEVLKKYSPRVEFVVNLAWFAPVIGSLNASHTEKDILNAIGNSGFNIGGMAALPMSFDDPRAKAVGLVTFIAGDVVYGYMNLLVASLLSKPEEALPLAPLLPGPLPAA